jgi:hypothetical protein
MTDTKNNPKENRAKMLLKNMGKMIGDTKDMTGDKMRKMVMAGRMSPNRG